MVDIQVHLAYRTDELGMWLLANRKLVKVGLLVGRKDARDLNDRFLLYEAVMKQKGEEAAAAAMAEFAHAAAEYRRARNN